MKKLLVLLIVTFVFVGCSTLKNENHDHTDSVLVHKNELLFRTSIHAKISVNDLNRVFAKIYLVKPKNSTTCSTASKIKTTKRCRVVTIKKRIEGLSINKENRVIFQGKSSTTECGYIKKTFLGSREVVLNNTCHLEVRTKVETVDDGVDIHNQRYALIEFHVERIDYPKKAARVSNKLLLKEQKISNRHRRDLML